MKPPRAFTFLALLVASILPASAADRLEQWYNLMPKDTVGILSVKSAPELLADWDKSTFSKFMQDEAVQRWTAPMRKEGDAPWDKFFKEQYGTGMYDSLKEYPGAVAVFFVLDDYKKFKDDEPTNVSLCEVGGKQKEIEAHNQAEFENAKKKKPDLKLTTTEINGVSVQIATEDPEKDYCHNAWVMIDDVLVESNSRKLMEYMIGAVKSGAGAAPGPAREHLSRIAQITQGGSDMMLYFNGVKILELGEQALADSEAEKKKEGGSGDPTMGLGIKPQQIMSMLGAHELQALAITVEMDGEQVKGDVIILHPEKPAGLLSFMRTNANEVPLLPFIPAGVLQGGVVRYDLTKFYDGLLGMIMKLGPQAMMVTMMLPQFEQQLGFKIRDDFLASLDDEMFTVQDGELLKQNQVIGLKIKDANKIGGALDGLKRFVGAGFGAFEESEYLGFNVSTLKTSQTATQASEVALCNTGKYLLISVGGPDTMNKVLSRMKDPSGPSIWDSAQVQKLLAIAPKNFGSASLTDVGSMINMIATAASAMDASSAAKKKGPAAKKKGPGKKEITDGEDEVLAASPKEPMLDSAAVPPKEVFQRYFGLMLGTQYSNPDSTQVHYLVIPPEAQ